MSFYHAIHKICMYIYWFIKFNIKIDQSFDPFKLGLTTDDIRIRKKATYIIDNRIEYRLNVVDVSKGPNILSISYISNH